jgi:outer membrane protein assembly factor BamB
MSSDAPRSRRRLGILVGAALALLVLAGGAIAFVLTRADDVSNSDVAFRPEPTPTPEPTPDPTRTKGEDPFTWAHFGYSKDRRRYLPASRSLRPPFTRNWSFTGRILLEFPPVIGGRSLYLLKNNGALYALSKRTGEVRWKRKLGALAASSPAFDDGRVYVTLLQRGRGGSAARGGRIAALDARTGHTVWSKPLASRAESSPLVDGGRVYFGSENGTVYSMRASNGEVRWRFKAAGAVKAAISLANGKLFFGDYAGRMYALRQADGRRVWSAGTSGARFGLSAGRFYSTPAVAYGRVYVGNTDGKIYSFSTDNGKLAWSKSTGGYVYASPAVAQVPGGRPTVYAGSYSGRFYALDARTGRVRWSYDAHGKISGSATVVGDVVYFANLGKKSTVGLGARTGRKVFDFGRGSFTPVVSDGQRIYLTGYSSLYALTPR